MVSKILILTSGYKRWQNDSQYDEDFVVVLAKHLSKTYDISVLAPRDGGSTRFEVLDDIKIFRHEQSPFGNIGLAYGSGIVPNLHRNKFLALLLPFFLLYEFGALIRIVKKEHISIIHAHWIIPQGLLAVLYKKTVNGRVKILATIHGTDIFGLNNPLMNAIKRYVLNNIDDLSVVSSAIKEQAIKYGYKKEIYVCPMGVDTTHFTPGQRDETLRSRLKLGEDVLLFVGRLVEKKGIRFLIEALSRIKNEYPEIKLLIIGDGNMRGSMMGLCKNLNLTDNVIFLGLLPHRDLPRYFATADVFVLPSLSEGFGLVLIEAMSCGTIPIATDLPAFADTIKHGVTGFLVKQANAGEISDRVVHILRARDKLSDMKARVRDYVVRNYDWNIVSKNYQELINRLINRSSEYQS